jgi:hypothetical protein
MMGEKTAVHIQERGIRSVDEILSEGALVFRLIIIFHIGFGLS